MVAGIVKLKRLAVDYASYLENESTRFQTPLEYTTFALLTNGEIALGNRKNANIVSSYLGELEAIVWACKKTKACGGDVPLIIKTDSHSIFDKYKAKILVDNDVRSVS